MSRNKGEPWNRSPRTRKAAPGARRVPSGADLHVHTTHSDGLCSPCEVVNAASSVGLRALAITDHDTLTALAVARAEANRLGLELVSGVELTAELQGREIHILGHFVQADDPALTAATHALCLARATRLERMAARLLELGLEVDLTALERAFPRATLGRRHLAEWLVRTRQAVSQREVFAQYLGDDGPVQVAKPRLPAHEAIALIRGAGGVAGLAHPPYDLQEATLRILVEAGLGSIEVDGHGVDARRGKRLQDWADRHALIGIAGSDFHAADRPGRWLGSITTTDHDLERLRLRAQEQTQAEPPTTKADVLANGTSARSAHERIHQN